MARCLVNLSARACYLARLIRSESELLSKVTEQKPADDRQHSGADHKTLADVLIQEMVRHGIEQQFPQLIGNVFGEENSDISVKEKSCSIGKNAENEKQIKVNVTVNGDRDSLKNSLSAIVSNNDRLVDTLTDVVYSKPTQSSGSRHPTTAKLGSDPTVLFNNTETQHLDPENVVLGSKKVNIEDVAVWIDPLDGTNVYSSQDRQSQTATGGITHSSLSCVTVLIGLFNKTTGEPLLGVVGKPFRDETSEDPKWHHAGYWGFTSPSDASPSSSPPMCRSLTNFMATDKSSPPVDKPNSLIPTKPLTVVVGHSENNSELRKRLNAGGCRLVTSSGAGYKQMCVVLGLADLYVGGLGTTSQWDTCGPHAILQGLGGGVVEYDSLRARIKDLLKTEDQVERDHILKTIQLRYSPRHPPQLDQTTKLFSNFANTSLSRPMTEFSFSSKNIQGSIIAGPPAQEFKHMRGLVAYRSLEKLIEFLPYLQNV